MRDAAYGLVSAEEKVAWHAAAGAFLESLGESDAVALAEHFRIGQQMPQAVRYYTRAAEQAFDGGGVDAALNCVERGLASGAQGLERGILLGMQVRIAFWHEEFEKIIRLGPETVSLLPVGDKRWAHAMEGLLSITTFTQPQAVPQMAEQFLSTAPAPEARSAYAYVATGFAILLCFIGQKKLAALARARSHEISQYLSAEDYGTRGLIHSLDGVYHNWISKLPYTSARCLETSVRLLTEAGHLPMIAMARSFQGKSLFEIGQRAKALDLLQRNLAFAEQHKYALSLSISRTYPILRRRLADIPEPALRATYLRELPENVRLRELATQWGFDNTEFAETAP